jgi:xanthine dehydrogenase accessory factor
LWAEGEIAVIADPETRVCQVLRPDILIDALMAKKNTGTTIKDAGLVIALGPGFTAGVGAHFVVETNPASPRLGQVIAEGEAENNTQIPTPVLGLTSGRLIRSPAEGMLSLLKKVGDRIAEGESVGYVESSPARAGVSGSVWGLVREGLVVRQGQKIGDIDPRGERHFCFQITPQARTIAEGVVRAIVTFFNK